MKSRSDKLHFTLLNMGTDLNKGDLAIIETTVRLLKTRFPECIINALNVNYPARIINAGKFKYFECLLDKHYEAIFPRVFEEGVSLFAIIVFLKNLFLSFWMLFCVILFRKSAGSLLFGKLKLNFLEILHSDIPILKGGSYIFCYGGIRQSLFLYRMIYAALISVLLRKPLLILGHSIGPIYGRIARWVIQYILKRSEKIVIREHISCDFLISELRIESEKIVFMPDLAFWFQEIDSGFNNKCFSDILIKENIREDLTGKIKIGMTLRRWHFPRSNNPEKLFLSYLDETATFVDDFCKRNNAVFFLMPHASEDMDVSFMFRDRLRCGEVKILKGDYSTLDLRRLYGSMDFFIGTRIHSCIFSISQAVPTLAIAYEIPKGFGIVGMIEGDECVIDIRNISADILANRIQAMLDKSEHRRLVLKQRLPPIRNQIEHVFLEIIKTTVNRVRGESDEDIS